MEARGLGNTIMKTKTAISQVLRYAKRKKYRSDPDPVPDLRGEFAMPKVKSMAALIDMFRVCYWLSARVDVSSKSEYSVCIRLRREEQ